MSVRCKHIARGGRVLEVPQICVRTRLRWDVLAFQVLVVQLCEPPPKSSQLKEIFVCSRLDTGLDCEREMEFLKPLCGCWAL